MRRTFDFEDYPVDVKSGADPRETVAHFSGLKMSKVMEVYAMHLDKDAQLAERRAYHLEFAPTPA